MSLLPEYLPTYIRQAVTATPKQVVTAARWNELFNLLITQGDNTTDDVVALLAALAATTAAANIGADVPTVVTKTVQGVLTAFEAALADRYTKTENNSLVATNTNDLVKSITFNDMNGAFTITKKDGSVSSIDTILEKVPVSMVFEKVGEVTRIKLTNQDGSTSFADVSALVDNYTFVTTDTIAIGTTGVGNQKTITATLRDGSVTLPKLALESVTQLEGYRDAAGLSATAAAASAATASGHKDAAAASEAAALNSKNAAMTSAADAFNSKNAAATSASEALTSKNAAATSASGAASSATTASTAETTATAKATEAASSAGTATTAASTATTKASEVTTKANAAATSETNAANSAIAAAGSATAAANSASASATSASNAATSEANSLTNKNASASSASAAAASAVAADASADAAAESASQAAAIVGQKVATFNGRSGIVAPQAGDYTAAMVEATPAAHETDATKHVGTATKTTPVDADSVALVDSADASKVKKLTWANLKTALTSVFAIKSHASSATTYGTGTSANHGHVKLSDATNSTNGVANATAATPAAVKAAYDLAATKVPTSRTINGKALSSDITLTASDVGAASATDLQAASSDSLIRDLNIMLNLSLGTSNIDAWADLLSDNTRINTGASSGYTLSSGNAIATTTDILQSDSSADKSWGNNSANEKVGQTFIATSTGRLTGITVAISKVNTPTDNLVMKVYAADKTTLLGTSLAIAGSAAAYDTRFSLPSIPIVSGTEYFFELSRSGSLSSSNYYNIRHGIGDKYSNGIAWLYNASWSSLLVNSSHQDFYFKIHQASIATIVWKSVAATEPFAKMAVAADLTLGTGTITFYVSHNGTTWTQITALNAAQAVSFTGTSVYLKAVITGDASLSGVAWGGY